MSNISERLIEARQPNKNKRPLTKRYLAELLAGATTPDEMALAKRLVQAAVRINGTIEYEAMRAKYEAGEVSEIDWLAWIESRRPVATESTSKGSPSIGTGSPSVAVMVDPKAKKYEISP